MRLLTRTALPAALFFALGTVLPGWWYALAWMPIEPLLAPLATAWFARHLRPEDRAHAAAVKKAVTAGKPPKDVALAHAVLREVRRQRARFLLPNMRFGRVMLVLVIAACVVSALQFGRGYVVWGFASFGAATLIAAFSVLVAHGTRKNFDALEAWALKHGAS